jgi:hypothetical protein
MAAIDPEKVAKAWATATPIHGYTVAKATQKWRESTPGWPLPATHQVFSVDAMFLNQEFQKRLVAARKATIKELIAGQIVGLGRSSNSKGIERISESFWIDAKVEDWSGGTASCDGTSFSEIGVVPTSTLTPSQPVASSTVGPPSKAVVILAAIAAYAKEDPRLERPPSERFRAYRAYISSHGHNPHTARGFSQKTFEKYEQQFRNRLR